MFKQLTISLLPETDQNIIFRANTDGEYWSGAGIKKKNDQYFEQVEISSQYFNSHWCTVQ